MPDENILKKEFAKKDVERIRNLVNKKYGSGINTQVGYRKKTIDVKEGVEFEENGKTWIIKNGIKQNITKLDDFKKLVRIPILCPECSKPLKTEYDKKMYSFKKRCLECVAKFETDLKINGQYEEYSKNIINNNLESYLKDYGNFLDDISKNVENAGFITEAGDIEKWVGNNKKSIDKERERLNAIKKTINSK